MFFLRKLLNKFTINFFPIYFITGPALTDILVTLSSIFNLSELKKIYSNNKMIILFFVIVTILFLLSGIFSNSDKTHSILKTLINIRFFIFILFIIIYFKNKDFDKISLLFCIIISFVSIDIIIQYIFNLNLILYEPIHPNRYSGFFGKELIAGAFISKFAPICLFFLFFKKNYFIALIIYIIFGFSIILSGEKIALLNYLITSIILLLTIFLKYKKFYIFLTPILVVGIIFILFQSNLKPLKRQLEGFYSQIGITINNDLKIDYSNFLKNSQYGAHYIVTTEIFLDNPILGIGPDNFEKVCLSQKYEEIMINKYKHNYYKPNQRCSTHPHNTHLQILSESGIFTYLVLLVSSLFIILNSIKYFNKIRKFEYMGYFVSFIIIIIPYSNSNYFNNWNGCIFHYILGLYLAFYFKNIYKEQWN